RGRKRERLLKIQKEKNYSKNRERLDEHPNFAIFNKFPQCYQEILEQITVQSNDEQFPDKVFYKIKNLP
ncbi:hypothetical protein VP01_6587g1, partial [Puccinia sorghi]